MKKEILSFATTWVNPEDIMGSDLRKTQKGKYGAISPMCKIPNSKLLDTQ